MATIYIVEDDVNIREHVWQRRDEKNQARKPMQEVEHRVEETQTLRQREASSKKRIVQTENLNHAARPADALPDVSGKRFCGKPGSHCTVNKGGRPAAAIEFERGMRVFGHGFDGNAAHFI